MSWDTFSSILIFIFAVFFIAMAVLGCLIILLAIVVGGVRGIRKWFPRKPGIDRDPMI